MDGLIWAGLVVVLVLWLFSGGPPGPIGLPIVGYLPFLSRHPYLDLQRLAKKYGDVFSLRLGIWYVVVLSNYQSTKEAFAKDVFIRRPQEEAFDLDEVTLDEEIEELLQHFEQNTKKPFCIRDLLASNTSSNIGSMMFGKRFKYDDPVSKMMTKAVCAFSSTQQEISWTVFFPWVKKILIFLGLGNLNTIDEAFKELKCYTRKEIEEHEKTLNPEIIRGFIDGFLAEIRKKKDIPEFYKEVLEDLVVGFFGAGSETVRLSVEWLVLVAASLPEAGRRIQSEIDDVVGRNRFPEYPDQKSMPFTEAFIAELNRWRSITPLNIRSTLTDTEMGGFFVSKHTLVISNLWAIHHDKKYWGADADEFRPERFLTQDGKAFKKWEHYIPFSGKQTYLGEPLAKVEVFLYFTSILQRFNVRLPDGMSPDFEGMLLVGLHPKAQDVILTKRH